MSWLHIILLSLIQGITEFLPISSSGHLILLPKFLGEQDQGLYFDLASHLGTLIAVILFFRKDLLEIIIATKKGLLEKELSKALPILNIIIGTLPLVFFGLFIFPYMKEIRDNISLMIFNFIFWGIVLFLSDKMIPQKTKKEMTLKNAFFIGLAQTLSLFPGTSRSGITMTMGRFLGYDRTKASKFSLLLAIPATFAAFLYPLLKLDLKVLLEVIGVDFWLICSLSFVFAYLALKLFLSTIQKTGFGWYAGYRVLLGIFLIYYLL